MPQEPSQGDAIRALFDALTKQERWFAGRIAEDPIGLILRTAINELDWYSYNLARDPEPSFEQQEQFYLLHIGMTRLIKLALESRPSFDVPAIMLRQNRDVTIPVLEIAAGLGMIEHGRRVAQMAMGGLGRVEQTAANEFVITLPAALPDEEFYERSVAEHFHAAARDELEKLLSSDEGRETTRQIDELLTELVYPFMEHFIGYDSDPALDTYFFGLASHILRMKKGYDSFNPMVKFGGVSFLKYILGLTFLVSLAIRHERSAEALVAKVPSIRLENVLTISAEIAPFLDDMLAAINLFGELLVGFEQATTDEVWTIFKVLSTGRDNAAMLDRPGSPLPLLIRTSDNDCIRCQTAVLANPLQYLLDSLRLHFPREYDENQRGREGSMQLALRRVLDDVFDGLTYRDNIRLRLDGRTLTDIDVVVLEPATGIVLLVQLKHQDIYGMDIHSRHSRGRRLKQQAERWLSAVEEWIGRSNDEHICSALRLPPEFPRPRVYRVIVARHFGHPIVSLSEADDTAVANWDQFYNATLLVRQQGRPWSLADLVRALRTSVQPGGPQHHQAEPRSEWIINDLIFRTVQVQETAEGPD